MADPLTLEFPWRVSQRAALLRAAEELNCKVDRSADGNSFVVRFFSLEGVYMFGLRSAQIELADELLRRRL